MVELFESKWDQDKYQWLRLHRETARAELRSRGDITDIVWWYIWETL